MNVVSAIIAMRMQRVQTYLEAILALVKQDLLEITHFVKVRILSNHL